MKIDRKGSSRNKGTKTIVPPLSFRMDREEQGWDKNVRWDHSKKTIIIDARKVPFSDGKTHHDYKIELTLEDISSLIALLGHIGASHDAKLLRDHLKEHLVPIVKLLACAADFAPRPLSPEAAAPLDSTAPPPVRFKPVKRK